MPKQAPWPMTLVHAHEIVKLSQEQEGERCIFFGRTWMKKNRHRATNVTTRTLARDPGPAPQQEMVARHLSRHHVTQLSEGSNQGGRKQQ